MKKQESVHDWKGIKRIIVWSYNPSLGGWEIDQVATDKRNGCTYQETINNLGTGYSMHEKMQGRIEDLCKSLSK